MTNSDIPPLSVSPEFADSYFRNRLHTGTWDTATPEDKSKALSWASTIILGSFSWSEFAYSNDLWALPVQYAVCEEALWLLRLDPSEYPEILTKGVSSAKTEPVQATFSKEFLAPFVCLAARKLVGDLGTITDGFGTVKSTMLEV